MLGIIHLPGHSCCTYTHKHLHTHGYTFPKTALREIFLAYCLTFCDSSSALRRFSRWLRLGLRLGDGGILLATQGQPVDDIIRLLLTALCLIPLTPDTTTASTRATGIRSHTAEVTWSPVWLSFDVFPQLNHSFKLFIPQHWILNSGWVIWC